MLTQPSTPVPLRLAKRIVAGIILVSSAYVASVIARTGLEFGFQATVRTGLARVASLTLPPKAVAVEKPAEKKDAGTGPVPAKAAKNVLVKPAKGTNWGVIHSHNGVDIANECGTPIVASAAGTVIEANAGWNGGYGNAVVIRHKNTKTHYAHLSKRIVSIGDVVAQGEVIGYMGRTGEATGCHLHFEVWGGPNPFGK